MVNRPFTRVRRPSDADPVRGGSNHALHRLAALGALLCLSAPAKAELLVNISKSQQRAVGGDRRRGSLSLAGLHRTARARYAVRQLPPAPARAALVFASIQSHADAVVGVLPSRLCRARHHGGLQSRPRRFAWLRAAAAGQRLDPVLAGAAPGRAQHQGRRHERPACRPCRATSRWPMPTRRLRRRLPRHISPRPGRGRRAAASQRQGACRDRPAACGREAGAPDARASPTPGSIACRSAATRRRSCASAQAWLRGLDRKYGITR